MVEVKTSYWEDLSKEGELNDKLETQIRQLMESCKHDNPDEIFTLDSQSEVVSEPYNEYITTELHKILAQFLDISDVEDRKKKYQEQIHKFLIKIHLLFRV